MQKKSHIVQFSKNSQYYEKYNFLQQNVAKYLISKLQNRYEKILDLGCGNGVVYSLLGWQPKEFVGMDLSNQMLKKHPKGENIKLLNDDFDLIDENFLKEFDLIISSSSLQWSADIKKILNKIYAASNSFAISIFCDKTFFSLREFFKIDTFLPSSTQIKDLFKDKNDVFFEKKSYKIDFLDNVSLLEYIKKSGVSSGKKILKVGDLKRFIKENKNLFLEFEVIFLVKES